MMTLKFHYITFIIAKGLLSNFQKDVVTAMFFMTFRCRMLFVSKCIYKGILCYEYVKVLDIEQ